MAVVGDSSTAKGCALHVCDDVQLFLFLLLRGTGQSLDWQAKGKCRRKSRHACAHRRRRPSGGGSDNSGNCCLL